MIDWKAYQKSKINAAVRTWLVDFLKGKKIETAIDLGCGPGNETVYMAKKGIKVLAIDKELDNSIILSRLNKKEQKNVTFLKGLFEEVELPKTDLVAALFSLPFCDADKFMELWDKIYKSLNRKGYLLCQLFGKNDFRKDYKDVITLSKKEIGKLLERYDIKKVDEIFSDVEGNHKHFYNIVAQKK